MRTFYLLAAIFLAALNLRPVITSVAPLLQTIQANTGMSGVAASLLTTLPVLCMGVFAVVATTIRDRIGLERTFFLALALVTAATVLRGLIGSETLLILTAVVAGIGISLAGPLLSGFIKKYFPNHPGIVSVYSASMTVGAAMASGLSIPVYARTGNNLPLTLACWAVLGVLALLIWAGLIRKRNENGLPASRSRLPIRSKRAWMLTFFFGLMASMFYSLTAWISPIAQSLGYSKTNAALLLTVFTLVQIPVSVIVPSLVARSGKRRLFLILCSTCELIGILLLLSGLPLSVAVVCLGLGAGGLFPLALMLPIVETDTAEEAGSWSAMSQCGGYVIGSAGPFAIGLLHDAYNSFLPAFLMMLAVILVMIGIQWRIGDKVRPVLSLQAAGSR
ncbi:MFS transporter [Paenibacillus oceani]|uniref:MFS transporter n=1 Tax=Paenibacillus oceani TaxID=2772510 RepID=A0A927CG90_9BACL|nr:MFS transporter [Paenibacillus oceani]MBD2865656.1 MFS transporter [Paenibacillus oceani]